MTLEAEIIAKVIKDLNDNERKRFKPNVIEAAQRDGYITCLIDVGHSVSMSLGMSDEEAAEFRRACGFGE